MPLPLGQLLVSAFPRVEAGEPVDPVAHHTHAVRSGDVHQAAVQEEFEHLLDQRDGDVGRGGGRPRAEVGYLQQAQREPDAARAPVERSDARLQIGADVERPVAQLVEEPVLVGEALGERVEVEVTPGGEPGGAGTHGEGQPAAGGGDPADGLRGLRHPGCPDDVGNQLARLADRHGADLDRVVAGQLGEHRAAGHQHGRLRPAREQRAHRVGGADVVEHHEDPASVEQAAVLRRALGDVHGYPVVGDAQRPQEAGEHLGGARRVAVGSAQVGEELTVGELVAELVGDVDGQRGLAQAEVAVQAADPHRVVAGGQRPPDDHLVVVAFHVVREVRHQLGGHRLLNGGPLLGEGVLAVLVRQDDAVDLLEFASGLQAELIDQHGAAGAVGLQRFGAAAVEVQGVHELRA